MLVDQKINTVNQADIGRAAALDPNTISQIIRGLEKKGLVQRAQNIDARSKMPMLTDAGIAVIHKALPAIEKADAQFFAVLTDSEYHEAIVLFQKLMVQP